MRPAGGRARFEGAPAPTFVAGRFRLRFWLLFPIILGCEAGSFEKQGDIVRPPDRDGVIRFEDKSIRGSAFFLNDGEHFVTNAHVVVGHASTVGVQRTGQDRRTARLVLLREDRDLAIYRIDGAALEVSREPISYCHPVAGLAIYAIGAPYGLPSSLLRGHIAHADRTGLDPFFPGMPMIQTQGITYTGMSGAGVFCEKGGFLGINRAAYGFGMDNGFGMIVPASAVDEVLRDAGVRSPGSAGF